MKHTAPAAAAALVLALSSPAIAPAMPGQSVGDFRTWAKANSALRGLAQKMNEMTADPYFSATFRTHDGIAAMFTANVGGNNKIFTEDVYVDTNSETYDIQHHLDTAFALVLAVYGDDVASDYRHAAPVGHWKLYGVTTTTALFRGKRFGYQVANYGVELLPLSEVASRAQALSSCVKQECGD